MGTKCRRVHKEKTSWQGGTSNLKNLFRSFVSLRTTKIWDLCHHTGMNKTNLFSTESLTDLQSFMFDTMLPADDCVDWFCDRHDVNATDEVIDFVVDAHFAFFGEWTLILRFSKFGTTKLLMILQSSVNFTMKCLVGNVIFLTRQIQPNLHSFLSTNARI